jgi:hypothetical protein
MKSHSQPSVYVFPLPWHFREYAKHEVDQILLTFYPTERSLHVALRSDYRISHKVLLKQHQRRGTLTPNSNWRGWWIGTMVQEFMLQPITLPCRTCKWTNQIRWHSFIKTCLSVQVIVLHRIIKQNRNVKRFINQTLGRTMTLSLLFKRRRTSSVADFKFL